MILIHVIINKYNLRASTAVRAPARPDPSTCYNAILTHKIFVSPDMHPLSLSQNQMQTGLPTSGIPGPSTR